MHQQQLYINIYFFVKLLLPKGSTKAQPEAMRLHEFSLAFQSAFLDGSGPGGVGREGQETARALDARQIVSLTEPGKGTGQFSRATEMTSACR